MSWVTASTYRADLRAADRAAQLLSGASGAGERSERAQSALRINFSKETRSKGPRRPAQAHEILVVREPGDHTNNFRWQGCHRLAIRAGQKLVPTRGSWHELRLQYTSPHTTDDTCRQGNLTAEQSRATVGSTSKAGPEGAGSHGVFNHVGEGLDNFHAHVMRQVPCFERRGPCVAVGVNGSVADDHVHNAQKVVNNPGPQ